MVRFTVLAIASLMLSACGSDEPVSQQNYADTDSEIERGLSVATLYNDAFDARQRCDEQSYTQILSALSDLGEDISGMEWQKSDKCA